VVTGPRYDFLTKLLVADSMTWSLVIDIVICPLTFENLPIKIENEEFMLYCVERRF